MVAPASNERTTSAIVARTAYLTSTSLVDLRPLTLTRSPFAAEWKSLAKSAPKNILANQSRPNTLSLPDNTDPIQLLLNNFKADDDDDDSLTTVLALANPLLTSRLLPSLPALIAASKPVVIHLAIQHGDLTPVLVLKSAVPFVLHSSTPQKAHDNALLAARLAKSTGKVVLHIFYATSPSGSKVEETSEDKVKAFIHEVQTWDLSRSPSPQLQVSKANGTNGTANGYANGSATANGNGSAIPNGVSLDNSDASSEDSYESGPNIDSHGTKVDTPLADAYLAAAMSTVALLRRPMKPFTLSPHHHHTASRLVVRLSSPLPLSSAPPEDTTIVDLSLISPFPSSQLATLLTPFVKEVIVLEQVWEWKMRWTPLFIDFATLIQSLEGQERPKLRRGIIGKFEAPLTGSQLSDLFSKQTSSPSLTIGSIPPPTSSSPELTPPQIPSHESSYFKVLQHVFGSRLEISNAPELVSSLQNPAATSPEFAVGRVKVAEQERKSVEKAIEEALRSRELEGELHELLSRWRSSPVEKSEGNVGAKIVKILESSPSLPALAKLQSFKHHFPAPPSRWIINSNSWSYDLGLGGIHAALASRLNVNLLILDTLPYTERYAQDPEKRKKDIGLYAMNYGGVYVASVALYGSYRGVLEALMEAEKWDGPSVVLAYLPYSEGEGTSALDILKETKLAIDSGYWPLYRYDPAKEARGEDPLSLDSDPIKTELQEFIDRSNHLSQLVRSTPSFATELVGGLGKHLEEARKKKAREAYESLLGGMDGPSILVLFASDGGNAEKIAKRLVGRAKARGVGARIQSFDSYGFTKLAEGGDVEDEYVIFITSTAGQGEPPQNGRDTFKALNATFLRGEKPFETTKLKYTVFGLGDSHYWPRPEDAGYYNKPGRDLDGRLAALGGERIADIGLGDDQDADGPETGYREWEVRVWKALGVDHVQILEKEPEAITNENIKIASNFLRGTIREGLADTTTGALAPSDGQLTKFHGIYEQDDRDIRDERKDAGLEPAYSFMIRCRLPGGVCTPAQWLAIDQIADEHGNSTFKLTTRQTFQFHGVIKKHLKEAVRDINRALMDTIAACGDVNRNVLATSLPELSHLHQQAYDFAKALSERLLPRTNAYHEIWLDKKQVAGDAVKDVEPIYGAYYLPRKFKMAVAIPPNNDVDLFANDVGFIAIANKDGNLEGFNVTAGGGMGVTHSNKKTYPRLGDVLGFVTPEQAFDVAREILIWQRDNGNRKDRKNARLKYTIDRVGVKTFKSQVEAQLGWKLAPARPYTFDRNIDDFGWRQSANGKWNFTTFIENGRVADEPGKPFKSALVEVARVHKGTFRLTANQHLIVADVPQEELEKIKGLLAKWKLDNLNFSGLRLSSSACVAFPTCGLAMAESERYLPVLIDKVETILEENGLRHDSIVMRMTGCPNGCARPYIAEIAFVGKSPGAYLMLLGGGYYGQRLNKIYRENVTEPEILAILQPMIKRYALERLDGERFGDFVIRVGYISATTEGKAWYDGMGGEGEHREVAASVS